MKSMEPSLELINCGFDWVDRAIMEIGQLEIRGRKHNPRILDYHAETSLRAKTDEIYWCASFICWCLELEGIPSTRSARARDYLRWGVPIEEPIPGCIVVFWRGSRNGSSGHVAIFDHTEGNKVVCLGGNQSDQVCLSKYELDQVLGYRMPLDEY